MRVVTLDEVMPALAARRRDMGLSQRQVATSMGVTQSTVSVLESGRGDVLVSSVLRYAQACGLELRVIVAGVRR